MGQGMQLLRRTVLIAVVAVTMAAAMVALAACVTQRGTNVTTAGPTDTTAASTASAAVEVTPTAPSSLDPSIATILANPNEHLDLEPLPAGHVAAVSQQQAEKTTFSLLNVPGPALYVAHGMGYVRQGISEPVWLVVAKVPDMTPFLVGPICPPDVQGCSQHWAVNDYAGALISDVTGDFVRSFTTMREVPAPTKTP